MPCRYGVLLLKKYGIINPIFCQYFTIGFLCLTIFVCFGILGLMENFSPASPSLKWKTSVFLGIIVAMFLILVGVCLLVLQKHISATPVVPTGWKTYDGGRYTFAYPPSWILKMGFNFNTDVAVYDPSIKKRWTSKTGGHVDWPLHYVDIVSVRQASETASDIVDNYEQSWQVSDAQIGRQTLIKNGVEYELYGVVGENTVIYQNLAVSNGRTLALLESSLSSLVDTTVENKILDTFQLK